MAEQLFPEPTVGGIIFNPENEILLVRSRKSKDLYVIPGGHIELGEAMEDALRREIFEETGKKPVYVATDAKSFPWSQSYANVRARIESSEQPFVILFGTGDGLDESVITESDILLQPIVGPTDYNHLSVRAAAAIILDRLLG